MKTNILRFLVISMSLTVFAFLSISSGRAQDTTASSGSSSASGGCCGGAAGSAAPACDPGITTLSKPYYSTYCSYVKDSSGNYNPTAPNTVDMTTTSRCPDSDGGYPIDPAAPAGTKYSDQRCVTGSFSCHCNATNPY